MYQGAVIEMHAEQLYNVGKRGVRVINWSRAIQWEGPTGIGHRPNIQSPAREDVAEVTARAKVLTLALNRLAAEQGRRPLVVIAAGNDSLPSYWGGWAAAKPLFNEQILVVGASTRAGTLAPFSNYGPDVEVVAPGADVRVRASAGVVSANGTSFAAPIVSGIAGLLLSFDPARSWTAADLKDAIVRGAENGKRTAGGHKLANAYESLKLAATRPGAPLCGNRVWVTDGGALTAQRGTGTEVLGNAAGAGDYLYANHGGRRAIFSSEAGDGLFAFDWSSPAGWGPTPGDPWDLPEACGIVYCRYTAFQYSHDRDLIPDLTSRVAGGFGIAINDTAGYRAWRPSWQVGVVPHAAADGSQLTFEAYKRLRIEVQINADSTADTLWVNQAKPYTDPDSVTLPSSTDNTQVWIAYGPRGDSLYIAKTPLTVLTQLGPSMQPCPGTGYFQGYPIEVCTTWSYVTQVGTPEFYSLAAASTSAQVTDPSTIARRLTQLNRPGRFILWMSAAEGGREVVVADGVKVGDDGSGWPVLGSCEIRWIDLQSGATTHGPVASAHSCETQYVGTVAPQRIPSGGPRLSAALARGSAKCPKFQPRASGPRRVKVTRFADWLSDRRAKNKKNG